MYVGFTPGNVKTGGNHKQVTFYQMFSQIFQNTQNIQHTHFEMHLLLSALYQSITQDCYSMPSEETKKKKDNVMCCMQRKKNKSNKRQPLLQEVVCKKNILSSFLSINLPIYYSLLHVRSSVSRLPVVQAPPVIYDQKHSSRFPTCLSQIPFPHV